MSSKRNVSKLRGFQWPCFIRVSSLILRLFFSLFIGFHSALNAEEIRALRDDSLGHPAAVNPVLPADSYVEVKTKKLAQGQVVWVNFDYLREKGYDVSKEGLTPELEKQILEMWGYMVPASSDEADAFTDEEKTFYADIYGGLGTHLNGSGRAASLGFFQVKGIGKTPLVQNFKGDLKARHVKWLAYPSYALLTAAMTYAIYHFEGGVTFKTMTIPIVSAMALLIQELPDKISNFTHRHGGASLREAVLEAIWGEVLHRELPYGANRVVAIISTGTSTNWFGVAKDPRALIVREDPLRPAHFMAKNKYSPEKDLVRVNQLATYLNNYMQNNQKEVSLESGLFTFARRIGAQYAAMYSLSVIHGATSPSNISMNGQALDYGTVSALDGYTKAFFIDGNHLSDNSVFASIVNALLLDMVGPLKKSNPKLDFNALSAQLKLAMEEAHREELYRQFLRLAGTPDEILEEAVKWKAGVDLAHALNNIARAGNDKYRSIKFKVPQNTGHYDLEKTLNQLIKAYRGHNWDELKKDPDPWIDPLRMSLVTAFQSFSTRLESEVQSRGVAKSSLQEYMQNAVAVRNQKRKDLFRGPSQWMKIYGMISRFFKNKDRGEIDGYINSTVTDSARDYEANRGSFVTVLKELSLPEKGFRIRRQYNAKAARYETVLLTSTDVISVDELRHSAQLKNNGQVLQLLDVTVQDFNITAIYADSLISHRNSIELRTSDRKLVFNRLKAICAELLGDGT